MFSNFRRYLFFCAAFIFFSNAYSNNLRINNITKTAYNKVRFNVSWDNSWSVAGYPSNHDAVWLFIKYYDCPVAGATGTWKHAKLSTTMTSHSFSGVEAAKPILEVNRLGTGTGHNTGVLIRRTNLGKGNIVNAICELQLAEGQILNDKKYEFKVFGLEMVQVPEGAYYLGDSVSDGTLREVNSAKMSPKRVESEGELKINNRSNQVLTLPTDYPKGFGEFYCMKYEITAGDYVAFLNTLVTSQIANLKLPNPTTGERHSIFLNATTQKYYTNRPDRACNYLTWKTYSSFLDWCALRPMTELEYEKACRGFAKYRKYEIASGATHVMDSIVIAQTISGVENGQEIIMEKGANINAASLKYYEKGTASTITVSKFIGGDGSKGPLSVGIFGRGKNSDRISSGATFFGIMEMSGNVWELVITCNEGKTDTPPPYYIGEWGDGTLGITSGLHENATWPDVAQSTAVPYRVGGRGASFAQDLSGVSATNKLENNYFNVSNRFECERPDISNQYSNQVGGRGVR